VGDHTKSAKLLGFFRQGTLVETIFTLQRFCSLRFLGGGGGGCLGVGKVGNSGWRGGFGSTRLATNPLTPIRSV
jgi:hypothetical protein